MSDIEEPEAKMPKLQDTAEVEMDNVEMDNVEVDNAELDNVEVDNAELDNAEVDNAEVDNVEMDNVEMENVEMDNGQEEWLSEEILTDEDYNQVDQSDSTANMSQEEGNTDSMASQDAPISTGENIERTLNNLENATHSTQQAELPEELGAFLIRKTDRRVVDEPQPVASKEPENPESELDESTKQSEDDGNDTDDLLRMLGDENSKKIDGSASQSSQSIQHKEHSSDEDDDEYIFEEKAKKLIMMKGGLLQKAIATRAVPEDTSDREADNHVSSKVSGVSKLNLDKLERTDLRSRKVVKAVARSISDRDEDSVQKHLKPIIKRGTSSDEALTMKRMFNMQHTKALPVGPAKLALRGRDINAVKCITNKIISLDPKKGSSFSPSSEMQVKFTKLPVKHGVSVQSHVKSPPRPADPQPRPALVKTGRVQMKRDEIRRDELDDEQINDELNEVESEGEGEGEGGEEGGQRLMRPERMDEEVPTDGESHSDEDSYYDEMPSSESDDADDWFTLDIRAEKAAEYIPMLGDDAKELLAAEEQRAAARLGALRRSASALVAGRRSLAGQLRAARNALAQLDTAIAQ